MLDTVRRSTAAILIGLANAVGPWLAVTLVSWWAIGDMSERNGYSQLLDLPQSVTASRIALAFGLVVALIALGAGWILRRRVGSLPAMSSVVLIAAVAFGVVSGVSLRVTSSRTDGANIGGGLLALVWPVAALAAGAVAGFAVWRMSGTVVRGSQHQLEPA